MVKFSIITPWLPPRDINRTVNLIDSQSYPNWEHLIYIDREGYDLKSEDDRRIIYHQGEFNNWGNGCRHFLTKRATGDWILYLDDDDILYPNALERIEQAIRLEPEKVWGYFSILLGGNIFFNYPPAGGLITGGQVFHQRVNPNGEPILWYDNNAYGADWQLVYHQLIQYDPILISDILGELPRHGRGEV